MQCNECFSFFKTFHAVSSEFLGYSLGVLTSFGIIGNLISGSALVKILAVVLCKFLSASGLVTKFVVVSTT